MTWHAAAKQYLERLGYAEWQAQKNPKRKKQQYVPSDYHRALIDCLNRDDENGFKALKMLQGYNSALGV